MVDIFDELWHTGFMKKYIQDLQFNRYFFGWGLGLLALIGILQTLADSYNWYYIFPNFDTPMHVLGGMLVCFFALAFTSRDMNPMKKLIWVIFWTIVVGIGVEIFEWSLTHLFHKEIGFLLQGSVLDTYGDIMHDFIGGSLAYCLAFFGKKL
jgi:hypothetical protein